MRTPKAGLVLMLALLLGACAAKSLSAEQRASIKRVSIAKVQMPEKVTVFGESAGGALVLGGIVGTSIQQGMSDLPTEFDKALVRGHTDLAAVLREDLTRKLTSKGFEVVFDGDPRADVTIAPVEDYLQDPALPDAQVR